MSVWERATSRARANLARAVRARLESGERLTCSSGALYMDGDEVRVRDGVMYPEALSWQMREALGGSKTPPTIRNSMNA